MGGWVRRLQGVEVGGIRSEEAFADLGAVAVAGSDRLHHPCCQRAKSRLVGSDPLSRSC